MSETLYRSMNEQRKSREKYDPLAAVHPACHGGGKEA